jgi:predicted PurR-regulated permease PerM
MTATRRWWWLAIALVVAALVWLLSPILMPFVVAALLAYLGNPLVERLAALRLPHTLAVVIVFSALFLLLALVPAIAFPLLERQVSVLVGNWPHYIDWLQDTVVPWIQGSLGLEIGALDLEVIRQALIDHWQQAGGIAAGVLSSVTRSWLALFGWLFNLVLIPVVTFYLLRDWPRLLARVRELLPRPAEQDALRLARECDAVLATFLRGQLLVMISLGVIYSSGLWIAGLDLAVLIGMTAGLVSFVPYLGLIVGLLISGVAAVMQFGELTPLIAVAAVFAVGQVLETLVLTPWLVGDRVGLHPVAVIFAVLAGGQLFGAIGVLLALPAAAVIAVLLRELHRRYLVSGLYDNVPPPGSGPG